jgi:hypothetical protein
MGLLNKLFGKSETDLSAFGLSGQEEIVVRRFLALTPRDRMGLIMQLGDAGKPEHWTLVKFAALHETDPDVRMSALKRLDNFPNKDAAIQLVKDLEGQPGHQRLEPYVSMAKVRLGLMTSKEFAARLKQ